MNLFEINTDEIIVFKYGTYKVKDWVIAWLVFAPIVYFLFTDMPENYRIAICIALLIGLPPLFYCMRNMRIVFDLHSKQVFRQIPIIGRMKMMDFDEIHTVEFVTMGRGVAWLISRNASGFYRIARKSDPLGKGVAILSQVDLGTQQAIDFNLYALPKLKACGERVSAGNQAGKPLVGYSYLKEIESGVYTYYNWNIVTSLFWVLLFAMGVFFAYNSLSTGVTEAADIYVPLVLIPLSLFLLFLNTKKITFNTVDRTFGVSYIMGLRSKEYYFDQFDSFNYVRNTHNMIYTGTDLNMLLKDGTSVSVTNYYRTRKMDELMKEITAVMFR